MEVLQAAPALNDDEHELVEAGMALTSVLRRSWNAQNSVLPRACTSTSLALLGSSSHLQKVQQQLGLGADQ